MEVADAAGVVVAIHNVPGESDMSVVLIDNLKVSDVILLGSCSIIESDKLYAIFNIIGLAIIIIP